MQEIKIVLSGNKESNGLEKRISGLEDAMRKFKMSDLFSEIKAIKKMIPKEEKDNHSSMLMKKIEGLDEKFYKIMDKLNKAKSNGKVIVRERGSTIVPYTA